VGDAVGVDVVQCPHQLLRDLPYLRLLETLVVLDYVEELALTELGDEDELGVCLEGVEEEDYVFVFEFFKDLYLVAHYFYVFLLLAFLFYRFDGHELAR
jgi:hypothetical protein